MVRARPGTNTERLLLAPAGGDLCSQHWPLIHCVVVETTGSLSIVRSHEINCKNKSFRIFNQSSGRRRNSCRKGGKAGKTTKQHLLQNILSHEAMGYKSLTEIYPAPNLEGTQKQLLGSDDTEGVRWEKPKPKKTRKPQLPFRFETGRISFKNNRTKYIIAEWTIARNTWELDSGQADLSLNKHVCIWANYLKLV